MAIDDDRLREIEEEEQERRRAGAAGLRGLREIQEEERARVAIRERLAAEARQAAGNRPGAGEHTGFDWKLIIVVACCVCLVPMVLVFIAFTGGGPESPAERRVRERTRQSEQRASQRSADETAARTFAEQFVRQSLKAPSTAQFGPYGSVRVTPMGADAWTVIGYVDAQNGFGAMLRSDWSVLLQKEGDRWRAVSVDIR